MTRYTRVGGFANRSMAELAATYLHANGIDAVVQADDAGGTHPHFALATHGVGLRVREEDADEARELLAVADAQAVGDSSGDPHAGRELRPVGKWIVRIAAAAIVAMAVASTVLSR